MNKRKPWEESIRDNDKSQQGRHWSEDRAGPGPQALINLTLPSTRLWTSAVAHSVSIDGFRVEWYETFNTSHTPAFFFPQKRKKDLKTMWSLWTDSSQCLTAKGPPKGGSHSPAVVTTAESQWSRRLLHRVGEIYAALGRIWTEPELVSMTQITGKQDIVTENTSKSRVLKEVFLYPCL